MGLLWSACLAAPEALDPTGLFAELYEGLADEGALSTDDNAKGKQRAPYISCAKHTQDVTVNESTACFPILTCKSNCRINSSWPRGRGQPGHAGGKHCRPIRVRCRRATSEKASNELLAQVVYCTHNATVNDYAACFLIVTCKSKCRKISSRGRRTGRLLHDGKNCRGRC